MKNTKCYNFTLVEFFCTCELVLDRYFVFHEIGFYSKHLKLWEYHPFVCEIFSLFHCSAWGKLETFKLVDINKYVYFALFKNLLMFNANNWQQWN